MKKLNFRNWLEEVIGISYHDYDENYSNPDELLEEYSLYVGNDEVEETTVVSELSEPIEICDPETIPDWFC